MSTRSKDLVDLVLLIERGPPGVDDIRRSLEATFATRGTHPLPDRLTPPPTEWATEFVEMATEARLSMTNCGAAFASLERFWTAHGLGSKSSN